MEERLKQLEGRVRGSKRDHDGIDDHEGDMDGFMIVDSVGDVDGKKLRNYFGTTFFLCY